LSLINELNKHIFSVKNCQILRKYAKLAQFPSQLALALALAHFQPQGREN